MNARSPEPSAHQADVDLARACATGDEAAWERFVREYRPALYRAADAMDPTGRARELADALFAELYGLREQQGERQSLFQYFHGRSSLATWLRAVLAQRHVDHVRATRRLVPLSDVDTPPARGASRPARLDEADPNDTRCRAAVRASLTEAIAHMPPRDRLRLRCYYVEELTLAAIGRMFGEHEASASRHLTRIRRELRAAVEMAMRQNHGFADAAAVDCLRSVMNDAGDLDLNVMLARSGDRIVQNEEESLEH